MLLRSTLLALASTALASTALAAADLSVAVTAPTGVPVYASGTYDVAVSNVGNRSAKNVSLTIALPETNTSPGVFVLGTLGSYDGRCSQSGTELVCSLGTLRKNRSTTVSLDLAVPWSAAAIEVGATASTTSNESNTANNTDWDAAASVYDEVAVMAGDAAVNEHCTGQNLTAFFECVLFPSSITSHDTVFEAGFTISFPGAPAGYTGVWAQPSPDRLTFSYFDDGTLVASFDGNGVDASCFEGLTTFPGSAWVSPYSVCLQ